MFSAVLAVVSGSIGSEHLDLELPQLIALSIVVILVMLSYFHLVVLDFKYQSMEYWRILLACAINLLIYIPIGIWVDPIAFLGLVVVPLVFMPLSLLNGKINRERIIGQADVDVALMQAIVTASLAYLLIKDLPGGFARSLVVGLVLQQVMTSLFIGLVLTIVIWAVGVLLTKLRTRRPFRDVLKDRLQVPTLVAFIPWVFVNLYNGAGLL